MEQIGDFKSLSASYNKHMNDKPSLYYRTPTPLLDPYTPLPYHRTETSYKAEKQRFATIPEPYYDEQEKSYTQYPPRRPFRPSNDNMDHYQTIQPSASIATVDQVFNDVLNAYSKKVQVTSGA